MGENIKTDFTEINCNMNSIHRAYNKGQAGSFLTW
jgi:hypothetical protein